MNAVEIGEAKRMFRIGMFATPPKVFRLPKFPKLTEDNIRTGYLEDAQYKKLIAYCPISGSKRLSRWAAPTDGESAS